MALQIVSSPNFLTPVCNPLQYNIRSTPQPADPTLNRYKLQIDFVRNPLPAITYKVGDFLRLNDVNILWQSETSPSFNSSMIPTGATVSEQVQFIEQILDNNIIFDPYDKQFEIITNDLYRLTLTSNDLYPRSVITYTSNTTAITFTETLPDFIYFGQLFDEFSVETKLYNSDTKFNFNVTAQTSANTFNFLSSQYKVFQENNQHWFNYSDSLQSVSNTDLYTLINYTSSTPVNIFQRDLNSLQNYSVYLYRINSTTDFGVRRFFVRKDEDKWIWNASTEIGLDTEPYYKLDYKITGVTTGFTKQSSNIILNYNLEQGDTIRIVETDFGLFDYICSSFTDNTIFSNIRYFKLEEDLSDTANNLRQMISDDFDICDDVCYDVTLTNLGYSKSIINLSSKTEASQGFTISVISAVSNNIQIENVLPRTLYNRIATTGNLNEISFLTNRPRANTSIYTPFSITGNYQPTPNFLSIFLTAQLLPTGITSAATQYCFRTSTQRFSGDTFFSTPIYRTVSGWPFTNSHYNDLTSSTQFNGLYHINVNPTAIISATSINNVSKIRTHIDTVIVNNSISYELKYSEDFEFDLVQVCDYETIKSFTFLNSLGGWDVVQFIDDLTTEYSRSQAIVNTRYDALIDNTTTEEIVLQNFINKNYKVSRIITSSEEYEWLYDLVKSSSVYFIDGFDYIPIIITNVDYISIENTNQYRINLEYRIAITDKSQKSV